MFTKQSVGKVFGIAAAACLALAVYAAARPPEANWSLRGYEPEDVLVATDQTPWDLTSEGSPGTPRQRLTYQQAIEQHDYRIQFTETCVASPAQLTIKNGTPVMFDTRGSGRHTIAVDGKTYAFNGAGFAIVTLSSRTLPHTVQVDCGTGKNNANIVLQR